jgi:predicted secreted acid phosphatase
VYHPASAPKFGVADYNKDIDEQVAKTETKEFQAKLEEEMGRAKTFIQAQLAKGQTGFVIFDIDETSLDNREFYRDPKQQYYKDPNKSFYQAWDEWISSGKAPALPVTKTMIDWLNEHKVPYCFVTGRTKEQEHFSLQNLKQAGLIGESCKGIYCKSNDWRNVTTEAHKKQVIESIEKELGLKAMASIGDRDGDMMLTEAERNFKLSSSAFYPTRS